MSAQPQKPRSEYQQIAAKFAAAGAVQAKELAAKRSKDEQVKLRNKIAQRDFKYSHGLLVALLLSFFYLHGVGIFLFTKGFLLTRLVLEHKSSCAVSPLQEYGDVPVSSVDGGCWHPKTFNKAVVVIIDALRYDFTVPYVPEDNTSLPHHYHNAFTTPYQIASKYPENAVLLPFIADPPTTTLQRLKGLTTGTLPTFIDAGSNFAGTAIDEDNVIAQLKSLGKRMAFMGDDTWMALFPGYFEEDMNHPYESLNVWDLHTVDNGVNEHIFPLLDPKNSTKWDVLFAHYLGVDHAGHRYGPDHFAMTEKLKQMDEVVRRLVDSIDNETLLVVMGDHGMDSKGDHGGESQGEVEAALWMYSKNPVFGRLPEELLPKDETRSVAQIDLVPTLSLLLGAPIPFNNLGAPIAEAFLGKRGVEGMRNLALVSRLTAAQIKRYQREYSGKNDEDLEDDSVVKVSWNAGQKKWESLRSKWTKVAGNEWTHVYKDFSTFQRETLRICKYLWARFDLVSMGAGVSVLLGSLLVLAIYARGFTGNRVELTDALLKRIRNGLTVGTLCSLPVAFTLSEKLEVPKLHAILFGTAMGMILGFLSASLSARQRLSSILPDSGWGFLSLLFTILNSVMFGSNSFTIWEDKTLSYFIATFAVCGFVASLRKKNFSSRTLGTYHSIMLLVLTRLASFSRLCREEQMPYCKSTFYASATSSVSAPWTLALLFVMALALPAFVADFYTGTKSYYGPAPFYIGWAFRFGLLFVATFWTLDSADNGSWFPQYEGLIKGSKLVIAQVVLAMALVAGHVGFGWSSLCLDVDVQEAKPATSEEGTKMTSTSGRTVTILGYANVHGSRYFLLVLSWALALNLLQKPMGGLSMGILLYQILTVLEIIDANDLSASSIGPVMLAILGNAHFFSTGHQATLSSIQWESAFIPLTTIRYPWSPLLVVANTLGPQILTAIAVPLVALWKAPTKKVPGENESLLGKVAKASATYVLFQATIAGASMVCAGWLRRHLMLYRIFSPRFMLGAVTLLVAELVCVLIGVGGVRWNLTAVAEVFGYA
ncbi:hypothetical protein BDD12DRAFT_829137 [Trichophaea hybrida]|nr:hypothetical protein BDD12DRAFT_829137 [Trichophaea hybrida]